MHDHLDVDDLTPAEAGEVLSVITEQFNHAALSIEGAEVPITGPVHLAAAVDTIEDDTVLTITLSCHKS